MPFARFVKDLGAPRGAGGHPEIRDLLREIAHQLEADHCVLWEPSLNFSAAPERPKGQLLATESTLPEEFRVPHAGVPADPTHDFSARYLRGDELNPWNNNFPGTDLNSASDAVMRRLGVVRVCAAHLEMGSSAEGLDPKSGETQEKRRPPGLISIYRSSEAREFGPEDAAKLSELAAYIPSLYRISSDRKIFDLFQGVRKELRDPSNKGASLADKELMGRVCETIRAAFRCLEVSIFLRDPEGAVGEFKLLGTTYREEKIKLKQYKGEKAEGLTGWVLSERKPVLIPDLAHFQHKEKEIQELYRGIQWNDSGGVFENAQELLGLRETDPLPPISFMSCPVQFGNELFGCIRCAIGTDPYYFSWDELGILQEIAAYISEAWAQEVEKELWHCLLASVGKQTEAFRKQIGTEDYDRTNFYRSAARSIERERFRGCQILSFRILDPSKPKLACLLALEADSASYTTAQIGGFWKRGKMFDAGEGGKSTISKLLHSKNVPASQIFDLTHDGDEEEKAFFKSAPHVLCVPVMIDQRRHGVFDLAFSRKDELMACHPQLAGFAEMFARNLALHEFRFEQKQRLDDVHAIQTQAYANVSHQLRSPLKTVVRRMEDLVTRLNNPSLPRGFSVEQELPIILGQSRKAARVTATLDVFARISRGERIVAKVQNTRLGVLWKIIIENLIDNRYNRGRPRNISFDAEQLDAFREACSDTKLLIDMSFSEQTVGELIANAFKYSAPGKNVSVHGAFENRYFALRVISRGVSLSEEEAKQCTEKFWRGETAKDVDADGSGLGLFLTRLLMEAQGGEFEAIPTNSLGETHMVLRFLVHSKG